MSRLDTSGDRNRSVLSSSGERNRSVLSASGERNRSVLSRSDDKKKKRFSSRFKAIKKKESIEELPKLLAPGEKIALEGRIKSPRVKHLELPMFFSKMIFDDKDAFIPNYLLTNTPPPKFKVILRALVEFSIVESCSTEFILSLLEKEHQNNNNLLPLFGTPEFVVRKLKEEKSTNVITVQRCDEYRIWMVPQAFVNIKLVPLIKNIDFYNVNAITSLSESIENEEREEKQHSDILNKEHRFYRIMKIVFPKKEPDDIIQNILECCVGIYNNIVLQLQESPQHELGNLVIAYTQFCNKSNVPKQNQDESLFWCFIYPLLNIEPIILRVRSKIKANLRPIYFLCVKILKLASINAEVSDIPIFNNNIPIEIKELLSTIRQTFIDFRSSIILASKNSAKTLSDTVLDICTVGDDAKVVFTLGEEIISNLDAILEGLLNNYEQNQIVLQNLVQFIKCGFREDMIIIQK